MGKKGKSKSGKKYRKNKRLKKYLKRYASRIQGTAQVPPLPQQAGAVPSSYVNDAVPDSSTLLAYKLLKDSAGDGNGAVFDDMLQNELKYLYGGISLLRNDSKISGEMGGETMANAAKLASIIKAKTKELDFNDRIENLASDILYHEYSKPGKIGQAPNRVPASALRSTNAGVEINYRASGATGYGITMNNNVNWPAIAQRGRLAGAQNPQAIANAQGVQRQRRYTPLFGQLY